MPKTAKQAAYPNSKLIQGLRKLSLLDSTLPHTRFVSIVGKFIDFNQAMQISELLDSPSKPIAEPLEQTSTIELVNSIQQQVVESRSGMIRFITQSFITENCPVSLRLPLATDKEFSHQDQGLSSYQRFYNLHQSSMEAGVSKLHNTIRRRVLGASSALSKLVAIDTQLNSLLLEYSRKSFATIPALLNKRFQHLCFTSKAMTSGKRVSDNQNPDTSKAKASVSETLASETLASETLVSEAMESRETVKPALASNDSTFEEGLPVFLNEMQSLLLAELDTRLQPTFGILEALATQKEEKTR